MQDGDGESIQHLTDREGSLYAMRELHTLDTIINHQNVAAVAEHAAEETCSE